MQCSWEIRGAYFQARCRADAWILGSGTNIDLSYGFKPENVFSWYKG